MLAGCVGSIPEELGALTELKELSLRGNKLTGKRRGLRLFFSLPRVGSWEGGKGRGDLGIGNAVCGRLCWLVGYP